MDCPRCGKAMVLRRLEEERGGLRVVIYEWSCRNCGLRNVIQAAKIVRSDGVVKVVDETEEVIKVLAEHFKVPASGIRIVSGLKSRNKVLISTQ